MRTKDKSPIQDPFTVLEPDSTVLDNPVALRTLLAAICQMAGGQLMLPPSVIQRLVVGKVLSESRILVQIEETGIIETAICITTTDADPTTRNLQLN